VGAGNVGFYYINSLNDYAMKLLTTGETRFGQSMYVTNNLGIGMLPPSARLHVASGSASITGTPAYLNNGGAFTNSGANSTVCAIFESSIWSKNTVFASSDIRIKKNIKDIDDDNALQKILAIEPKTYQYIDDVYRGSNLIYGFIAQQIEQVIPEAINIQNDILPNIFDKCKYSSNVLTFNDIDISTKSDICIGSNIKLYDYNKDYTCKITDYTSNSITIDKSLDNSCNIYFAYGTEVNDFHSLDKNYIYTLNVCATQILSRKIDDLYSIIERQQQQIDELKTLYGTQLS
jgi:hypothetical protein